MSNFRPKATSFSNGGQMPSDYQHKWQGLIVSPLLRPVSIDLSDE